MVGAVMVMVHCDLGRPMAAAVFHRSAFPLRTQIQPPGRGGNHRKQTPPEGGANALGANSHGLREYYIFSVLDIFTRLCSRG